VAVTTSLGYGTPQQVIDTMKAANPTIRMLGYAGSMDMGSLQGEGLLGDASGHPEWRLSSREGYPLMGFFDGGSTTPQRALFDPGGNFRQFLLAQILAAFQRFTRPDGTVTLDGVFLDNAVLQMENNTLLTSDASGNRAAVAATWEGGDGQLHRPWNPRTNDYYTDAQWSQDISDTVAYVSQGLHARYPNAVVIFNEIAWWNDGASSGGVPGGCSGCPSELSLLSPSVASDGGDMENFVHAVWDIAPHYYDSWGWSVSALATYASQGKALLATSGVTGADLPTQQQINMYTMSSYLLGAGPRSAYGFLTWDAMDPAAQWWPGFAANIGTPVGTYAQLPDGLYQRVFTGGLVLVNNGDTPIQHDLGRPMQRLNDDGSWAATSAQVITLGPRTGALLR